MDYENFLKTKMVADAPSGFDPGLEAISTSLFDFQRYIVRWACRRGRAALFENTGMGKTRQQVEWARLVQQHTDGKILMLAPLAVADQTVREAKAIGVDITYCRSSSQERGPITITNYEMMEHFDAEDYIGVVLDESSCLKAQDSKTRERVTTSFYDTPYRLAATATPAPNDWMELAGHAEFLGVMRRSEMLATFFVHDGGDTQSWRLKGHAENDWWRWVCSWAVMLQNPADLGFDGSAFDLPPLEMFEHVVASGPAFETGSLFATEATTLNDQRRARKASTTGRVARMAELANSDREQWIIWCDLNSEGDAATAAINGAVQVSGSDDIDFKIEAARRFVDGDVRVLVSKPSIFGWGLNWQNCARMGFLGVSHSYEAFYQALRRIYRFGQKRTVQCHVVTSEQEGAVLANLKRKEVDAQKMIQGMLSHMSDISSELIRGTARQTIPYNPSVDMVIPEWLFTKMSTP